MDGITPPLPPPEIKRHDLTSKSRGNGNSEDAALLSNTRAENRSPAAIMRAMGFCPTKYMTPMQFLIAVYNDDLDLIYKNERRKKTIADRGGIGMAYRLEAAKTASKYVHMELPKTQIVEDGDYGASLHKAALAGNDRIRKMTVIMETIENISPDIPLAEASYPAMYQRQTPVTLDEQGVPLGEDLDPEGDREYNPDDD